MSSHETDPMSTADAEGEAAAVQVLVANGVRVEQDPDAGLVCLFYGSRIIGRGDTVEDAAEDAVRKGDDDLLDELGVSLHFAVVCAADFTFLLQAAVSLAAGTETGAAVFEALESAADADDDDDEGEDEDEDTYDEDTAPPMGDGVVHLDAHR